MEVDLREEREVVVFKAEVLVPLGGPSTLMTANNGAPCGLVRVALRVI